MLKGKLFLPDEIREGRVGLSGLSESFEVLLKQVAILPSFTKESEEYLSRVASQKHKVDGDFRWLLATFDNLGL